MPEYTVAAPGGFRDSGLVAAGGSLGDTGRITAFDAHTGRELWADTRVGQIHWQSPIVVNGAVYIADLDRTITAWALPRTLVFRR